MAYVEQIRPGQAAWGRKNFFFFTVFLILAFPVWTEISLFAAEFEDEFSFELEEFEKKPLVLGGYAEAKWEHLDINQSGALAGLNYRGEPPEEIDRLSSSLNLAGSYVHGMASAHWQLKASGQWQDNDDTWIDTADVYEAYVAVKVGDSFTGSVGKKSYKWGKGYAWNPVGFINRSKDPNNPEEALEGYISAESEYIKSFSSTLQNMAFTLALIPVWQGVNEDFGKEDNLNFAAKLYLLYKDTDIDLLFYSGNSRSTRLGVDFSRNISSNFEIHGEYAFFPDNEKIYLEESGDTVRRKDDAHSVLLGLRYLNTWNLTSIIEYYHNGQGYREKELNRFYQLVRDGLAELRRDGQSSLLQDAIRLGQQGYTKPYMGRDYLYARFSLKEPGDILYLTPALTALCNLDDQSFSVTPEVIYTGFTNWEMRFRISFLLGSQRTEYGEKQNDMKLEFRLRYFF